MRATTKNSLRQIRHQLGSLLGVMIIVGVAVGFYATLKTSAETYSSDGESYFARYHMPSAILYGSDFSPDDLQKVEKVSGASTAELRATVDARRGNDTLRLQSYDIHDPRVNVPYIYNGQAPRTADECLLLKRYAAANNVHVGDKVAVSTNSFTDSCTVTGLATSPEHAYLAKNAATPIADPADFGILYVDNRFAERNHVPFSQIALLMSDMGKLGDVERALGNDQIYRTVKQADIYSYDAFHSDVGQFNLFAYIFPLIFLIISAVVIYVSQRRNVLRDRRQIGIMKAMGLTHVEILWHYLLYALAIVVGGALLGVLLAMIAGPLFIDEFSVMLDVPGFGFNLPAVNILVPVALALLVCLFSTFVAVRSAVRIQPAEAMHAEKPQSGHDIWLQRLPFWLWLSFNTRYSLKSALRNRGRFAAMVVGMIATITLLTFSLGLRDSFTSVTMTYFDKVAAYDLRVNFAPRPLAETPDWLSSIADSSEKALSIPGKLASAAHTEDLALFISDKPFAMHHLTGASGQTPDVGDGIVLPRFYANRLGVKAGDDLRVYTQDKSLDGHVRVTGLTEQMMGFNAIMTFATAERLGLKTPVYNTLLVTTKGDANSAKKTVERKPGVDSVSSRPEEKASIEKFTGMFNLYIIILVGFSIVLGIATLYSISTISLLARQYEFILLRVMGYSRGDILRAYTKELLLQAVIAVPIGAVLGYLITLFAVGDFATDSIAFKADIHPATYLYAALILIGVLIYVLITAARQLRRQNLVQGLKSREE